MLDRVRGRADALGRRRRRTALGAASVAAAVAMVAVGLGRGGTGASQVRTIPPAGGDVPAIATPAPRVLAGSSAPAAAPAPATMPAPAPPSADAAVSASEPLPAVGPRGRLAFVSDGRIWVMNADGSGRRALTPEGLQFIQPAWSPDGKRLAAIFYAQMVTRVALVELDGTYRFITDLAAEPQGVRWSPDGSALALTVWERGLPHADVFLLAVDGSWRRRLDSGSNPDWSPDGTQLVYTCGGLCVINADGTGRRVLPVKNNAMWPRWSPDGEHLLLMEWINGAAVLVSSKFDGTDEHILDTQADGYEWSPDGQWVAFLRWYDTKPPCPPFAYTCDSGRVMNIWLVRPDGTGLRQLTTDPWDTYLAFGPP